MKSFLKRVLTEKQKKQLRMAYLSRFHRRDLAKLALGFATDKEGPHHYAQHYQKHFWHLRNRPITLLEIGVGGYDDPHQGGGSLRMWKAFFPKGRIYGIDLYDKSPQDEKRIKTFQGSQIDEEFLKRVIQEIGPPDVIIDDGSHHNDHVIETFGILFPLLAQDGIYVVEDLQTSYWDREVMDEQFGGSSYLEAKHTSMAMLKRLVDGLNYEEFMIDGYEPSYTDQRVVGISFYHNLCFIQKGENKEGSNVLGKGSKSVS